MPKSTKTKRITRKLPPMPRERQRALPSPDAFAFTLEDAQAMGAPGRTKIYELAKPDPKTGAPVLKIFKDRAGRTMIAGDSLRAFLQPAAA